VPLDEHLWNRGTDSTKEWIAVLRDAAGTMICSSATKGNYVNHLLASSVFEAKPTYYTLYVEIPDF
jgi:hypothetical protein